MSNPTDQERQVLELAQQGASKAQIREQVWGYKSGKLYPEIDRILDKFSRAPVHVHQVHGENEAGHGAPGEE